MAQMELSRSEYPAIVASVPATPAVKLLRDRLQRGQTLNSEISEWLQERRRAEDTYAQALSKLAKKPLPTDGPELGVFSAPWARIVDSTAALATEHHEFAHKLETEVERLIRDFALRNSEWAGMKTMETNLSAAAKAIDVAEERTEKLRKRGQKAKAQQVAEAATALSNAHSEWESQAPFVFEKLQSADESRCNSLRDALTRLHTLELDHAENIKQAAEANLAAILDINTNDEIKGFANKAMHGHSKIERKQSRTANHGPYPSTPSIVTDDSVSVQSSGSGGGGSGGGTHSGGLGLKRLGTVLRNRSNRNSMFHRSASPDKRPRGMPPPIPTSPHLPHLSKSNSPKADGNTLSVPGSPSGTVNSPALSPPLQSNGDQSRPLSSPSIVTPPPSSSGGPPSLTITSDEPRTDAEGYSIPPPVHDLGASPIFDEGTVEEPQPQFKVEIKNDVIREEEEEADAALSKVANALRADCRKQNTASRKTRGRRDVRNTMFFPSPPELTPDLTGSPPLTPLRITTRPSTTLSEEGSDTHSIKSARSVASLSAAAIRHPDLTEPGLSASLVESVSVTFEAGHAVKTLVAGEIALAYNPQEGVDESTATIRMDNFSALEKVAPNPAFISAIPDRMGEYTVTTHNIHKTSVAFKYQVHIDEPTLASFAPIIFSPVWRLEPNKSSVIVNWRPNPIYHRLNGSTKPITLRNVVVFVGVEGAHASACQSKPTGTFSREKCRLAWKLGDLVLDASEENAGGKLLARFATDALARSTPVEARWEISGEDAESVGSGLGLSTMGATKVEEEADDPFADTEDKSTNGAEPSVIWNPVTVVKKAVSGKYMAS